MDWILLQFDLSTGMPHYAMSSPAKHWGVPFGITYFVWWYAMLQKVLKSNVGPSPESRMIFSMPE